MCDRYLSLRIRSLWRLDSKQRRLGEIVATLRSADPRDEADLYEHIGHLRLNPGRSLVQAEAQFGSTGGHMVRVGGAT